MLILACDTSGSNCSVALLKDDTILAEYNMNFGKQHSALLMPMIQDIMAQTSTTTGDLTHLAVNLGPGSFTGLRIGLSVLQAMSYALSIPLYGYTSFQSSAESLATFPGVILILHDALKKTFYSAAYENTGNARKEILAPDVRSLPELQDVLPEGKALLIAGDGLVKYGQAIREAFPEAEISEDSAIQRASALARLARRDAGQGVPPSAQLVPRYMRKPQAEREYEAKHGHGIDP